MPSGPFRLAALAALPAAHKDRAAGAVQIALIEIERFADPQPGAPEQDDQGAKSLSVGAIADSTHHRDELLDGRRVGRVVLALVPQGASAVIARHRRRQRRWPATSSSTDSMMSSFEWIGLTIHCCTAIVSTCQA
jgi:hypothetical protein